MATAIPGVTVESQVRLTSGMVAFLRMLRRQVPETVPLTVTSGERAVAAQARAMLAKYQAGDDLLALYQDDTTIRKLLATERTASAWTAVLDRAVADGAPVSRHLGGGAVDLHRGTAADVQAIVSATQQLGGRALVESKPPCVHIDLPAKYASMTAIVVGTPRRTRRPSPSHSVHRVLGGLAAAGGFALLGWIGWRYARGRR